MAMRFFIVVLLHFLFFPLAQVFAASYDLGNPYEEGAYTVGWSNPSSIRLSFATSQDLTRFFSSERVEEIRLSLAGREINIPASSFVKTERTSINENFKIFNSFPQRCVLTGKIHNQVFAGGLYQKHTTPSGAVLYDLSNPLEAIRFEFNLNDGQLNIQPKLKYFRGSVLIFQNINLVISNPFPSIWGIWRKEK